MPVHLEALQAFRLGQNAEILRTFGLLANLRISREQAYIGIVQQAELIDVKLPSYSESDSPNNLLELIMTVVRFYRPDLIDPFMTGCCSGKVFWLSKLAIEVPDIGTGDDWQHDWDNTVRALYFGASKVGILEQRVTDWIAEVRDNPKRMSLMQQFETYVGEGYFTMTKALTGNTIINYGNMANVNQGGVQIAGRIETHLKVVQGNVSEDVFNAFRELTQSVVDAEELEKPIKNETLDLLEGVAEQAALPADKRSIGRVKLFCAAIAGTLSAAGGLAEVWSTWGPQILRFFGLAA